MRTTLTTIFVSLFIVLSAIFSFSLINSQQVSAQSAAQLACEGTGAKYDKSKKTCVDGSTPLFGDGGFIEKVVNTLLFIIGGIAVVMVIVGGLRYVISAGDQNAVTAAKNTILYAVMGLVIAMLAFAIVRFLVGALS